MNCQNLEPPASSHNLATMAAAATTQKNGPTTKWRDLGVTSRRLESLAVVMWLVFFPQLNHVVRDLMFVVCLYLFPNKLILILA